MKNLQWLLLLCLGLLDLQANAQQSALKSQMQAGFVPGLKEAVKLMSSSARWEVVVPPQLGYGSHGSHGVARNAVLIFSVEILGVN